MKEGKSKPNACSNAKFGQDMHELVNRKECALIFRDLVFKRN
jgi:hypothetical protein